jgi:signal transduction histidine kinase
MKSLEMTFWRKWFDPRRRLLTLFLAIAILLAVTLLWLGWQLARQDRELAAQRLQERREVVADLAVAALQKSLSSLEEQVASLANYPQVEIRRNAAKYSAALPNDSVLVIARRSEIEAYPDNRLPFYPVVAEVSGTSSSLFAEAEALEFGNPDYARAIARLREVARSKDPAIRAAALMRIARIHRKQSQWTEALAAYDEMMTVSGAMVEERPAELVVRQGRLSVFERQKRKDAARQEADALLAVLGQRRWRLTRGVYEFYREEAQRVSGSNSEDTSALALASTVETLYQTWQSANSHAGRSLFRELGQPLLALWRGSKDGTAALVLGPEWLREQWNSSLKAMLASQGVTIGLTDLEGHTVIGPGVADSARQTVRLASATQLPWNLHAFTTNPDIVLATFQRRQRLLLTGLAVIALLILTGSYLIGRAVMRELALSRLQSDFVSAVSHEFRTPLTSLCLLTEQLASGRIAGDGDKAEYYEVLARESQRLRRLVEGLLNFGRMEAGAVEYRFHTIDPAELVHTVAREFEQDVEARGYHVEVHANGDTPLLRADRAALACAVWNLLDNAVKYSPECRTVWADVASDGGRAAIRVRDQGFGIPAVEQARIFEKFVRGEKAKEASIRGTGVGLAMVHHIVVAHGGEIRLESKTGEGSTFTLLLPAVS